MGKYNVGWGITKCCNMNCKFCYSKETRHSINDISINDWIKLDYLLDDNYDKKFDEVNFVPFYNPLFPDEIIKQYFKITRFEIISRNYKGLRIEKGSLALIIEVYDDKSTSN